MSDSNYGHVDVWWNTGNLQNYVALWPEDSGSDVCWFGTHNREDLDEHF